MYLLDEVVSVDGGMSYCGWADAVTISQAPDAASSVKRFLVMLHRLMLWVFQLQEVAGQVYPHERVKYPILWCSGCHYVLR